MCDHSWELETCFVNFWVLYSHWHIAGTQIHCMMILFCHKLLALLHAGCQSYTIWTILTHLISCYAELSFVTSHTVNKAGFMSRYTMSKHCCSFQFQYYTSFSALNLKQVSEKKTSRAQILSILLQIAFVFFNTWGEAKCKSFRK